MNRGAAMPGSRSKSPRSRTSSSADTIEGEREYFGALVLGYYKDGELVYAGNVGSGFTQQSLKSVFEQIKPLITKKPVLSDVPKDVGEVTWVKPELVCTVKFTSWTDDNRLRAPVFLGLRNDVTAERSRA